MQEFGDNALLREYVEHASEEAFALLVTRHINKVYSVALRHTRNAHRAEEITQSVFVILAQKARHLGKGVVLSGWLYQTARLTAVTLVRSEIRRTHREQEAHMQTLSNAAESGVWPQIEPLLDTAMAGLNEMDRHAVVLRFFDGKSMKEVGVALGGSEDAAKMRVNRAVEKLRLFFTRRGIVLSAAALTAAISANAVQAAPVGLAVTISTAAAIAGTALAATATAAATKTILMTLLQKALVTATVAALAGVGIYEARQVSRLRKEIQSLQQQQTEQSSRERDEAASKLAGLGEENERLKRNTAELLKLRAEAARLRGELKRSEQAGQNKLDAERAQNVAAQAPGNPPPVETYSATARAVVPWNQALISGGWKTPSGKMVYVLAVPTRTEDAGVVMITAHVVEASAEAATRLGLDQSNTGDKEAKLSGVLTTELLETIVKTANNTNGVTILSSPRVTLSTGGRAAISSLDNMETPAGEKYSVGPRLTFMPTISADGQSVDLGMEANVNYPSPAASP